MSDDRPPRDATEALESTLSLAREQRRLLSHGNLGGIERLQASRQQLLEHIQSLDAPTPAQRRLMVEIGNVDREMRLLLASEFADIKGKLKTVTSLRSLIRSRKRPTPAAGKRLSCRV